MKVTTKGNKAWVTFTFTPSTEVQTVEIVGEWNDWTPEAMKAKKSGEYYLTKIFKCGESYQFGYRVDQDQWHLDNELQTVASPFGSHNSILEL